MANKKSITSCSTESSCEAVGKVKKGKRLLVTDSGNCTKQLDPACKSATVPVQGKDGEVELRDGSLKYPFELGNLQNLSASTITNLIFQKGDGSFSKWTPPQVCGEFKLSIVNGRISVVEDSFPTTIPADLCAVDCGDVDYLLGVKLTQIQCGNGSVREVAQLRMVPKCCCTEEEVSSLISGIGQ